MTTARSRWRISVLLPAFTGQGLGRFMLTAGGRAGLGARRGQRLAAHVIARPLVWRCSNYLARGFSIWKQETYDGLSAASTAHVIAGLQFTNT